MASREEFGGPFCVFMIVWHDEGLVLRIKRPDLRFYSFPQQQIWWETLEIPLQLNEDDDDVVALGWCLSHVIRH